MLCFIYKWIISRARDLGKEQPGVVKRHQERCRGCRDFARLSKTLQQRLSADASKILQGTGGGREETFRDRIQSALDAEPFPAAHGPHTIGRRPVPQRRRRLPVPVLVPVMIVIGTLTALFVLLNPPTAMDPVNGGPTLLSRLTPPSVESGTFGKLFSPVETNIESEMRDLGKSVKTAANHLIASLSAGTRTLDGAAAEKGRLP